MMKSVLLYGVKGSGKTLLSQIISNCTGSNFFDISPRNTDGKFTGKQVSIMIHMVK